MSQLNDPARQPLSPSRVVGSDSLKPGRWFNLNSRGDVVALGLEPSPRGSSGFFILKDHPSCRFFARTLPSVHGPERGDQILWETDLEVAAEDVELVIGEMLKREQAIHINTGVHGRLDGTLESAVADSIDFFVEDFSLIQKLEKSSQVSIHCVTAQARPFAPPKANMIINAWCHSHAYDFVGKMDPTTGEVPKDKNVEYLCNMLPRKMRKIIMEETQEYSKQDASESYLENYCSDTNPDVSGSIEKVPCSPVVQRFLEDRRKHVLLVQGQAGAGKSTIGKKWAIEIGDNWEVGKLYPIFIYLPTFVSIEMYLQKAIGQELSVEDRERFVHNKAFFVVLDGYDEMGIKKNVVEKISRELHGCRSLKALITCRSDYLRSDGTSHRLFRLPETAKDSLQVIWLCPLDLSDKEHVSRYVDYHLSTIQDEGGWTKEQYEEALETIPVLNRMVKTPFCLKVTLEMLPRLHRPDDSDFRITRHDIYNEYVHERFELEWRKLVRTPNLEMKRNGVGINDENCIEWYCTAARALCIRMHQLHSDKLCLRPNDDFFAGAPFHIPTNRTGSLEGELGYWLLRGCLTCLKRQLSNETLSESLEITFVDETFRTFFLVDSILANLKVEGSVPIGLSLRNLREEPEIIAELAELVRGNPDYQDRLFSLIHVSRAPEIAPDVVAASANAASVLVAAGVSFSGLDLHGVRIPGAVLRDGIFHKTNFAGADLSGAILTSGYFEEACFDGVAGEGAQNLVGENGSLLSSGSGENGESFEVGQEEAISIDSLIAEMENLSLGEDEASCKMEIDVGDRIERLVGRKDPVSELRWRQDGKMLACLSLNNTVRVWEVETGECRQVIAFTAEEGWIRSLAWRPDGKKALACVDGEGSVMLRDVGTKSLFVELMGHDDLVEEVSWRPDGTMLASGSHDETVRVWEVATGSCCQVLAGHSKCVESVSWGPDGNMLASGSYDETVRIWEVATGSCCQVLVGHEGCVETLSWRPDGKMLATGAWDRTARVWEVATGSCCQVLRGHEGWVESVSWRPDGKLLATGSYDETVRVWEVETETGRCCQVLRGLDGGVKSVSWGPDGEQLASGSTDGSVKVWYLSKRHGCYLLKRRLSSK